MRAHQFEMAADLISQSPGKTILKRKLDPSQCPPRPNVDHIARQLRASAVKIRRNPRIPHLMRPRLGCAKGVELIELVPYDRYLWLFQKGMFKHPRVSSEEAKPNKSFMAMKDISEALTQEVEEERSEDLPKPYEYPKNIADDLDVVLEGLNYVYTGSSSSSRKVPRIQWRDVDGEQKPVFFDDGGCAHDIAMPVSSRRCAITGHMPYDEREYVWLKAFVNVVSWMEENFNISLEDA